jgi:regulatory protein
MRPGARYWRRIVLSLCIAAALWASRSSTPAPTVSWAADTPATAKAATAPPAAPAPSASKRQTPEEADEALARLERLGYLDDAKLAGEEAGRLRERKGLARAGVVAELERKGAGRAAIDLALAGEEPADELARADDAARRWLSRGRRDGAALGRFLARKGYPPRVIFRVLNELVPEAPDEDTP